MKKWAVLFAVLLMVMAIGTAMANSWDAETGTLTIDDLNNFDGASESIRYDSDCSIERSAIRHLVFSGVSSTGNLTCYCNYNYHPMENLTSVSLNEVTSIGDAAFEYCGALTSVSMPNVTSIGGWAFEFCDALTSVSMPSVTSIDGWVFSNCKALTSIDLTNITSIGNYAFYRCGALTTVSMPNVTSIGGWAFQCCGALTTVSMPKVTDIGVDAFSDCRDELTIYGEAGSYAERFARENGINFNAGTALEYRPIKISKKATVLPGKTITLTPKQPGVDGARFLFESSAAKVAKVSKAGVVTGLKSGKAIITITSSHGETAKVTVTVKSVKIKLNKTSVSLKKGKTFTIKASQPDTKGAKYTYKTSNKKIATVDKKGKIKAVKAGSATITVTSSFGETAKVKVTVK